MQTLERFCSALPFTHTSTLAELMQTTNTVARPSYYNMLSLSVPENNLFSIICLSSNGLSGRK
jgi:hypothetical protein